MLDGNQITESRNETFHLGGELHQPTTVAVAGRLIQPFAVGLLAAGHPKEFDPGRFAGCAVWHLGRDAARCPNFSVPVAHLHRIGHVVRGQQVLDTETAAHDVSHREHGHRQTLRAVAREANDAAEHVGLGATRLCDLGDRLPEVQRRIKSGIEFIPSAGPQCVQHLEPGQIQAGVRKLGPVGGVAAGVRQRPGDAARGHRR